ncbi:ADOP family duplicated permease [Oleiagrimonas soli]|uniref:Permease n=1 Tax=Oleiagrimonas soli TaxID=1543381 RepID=A0A099CTL2_9GAMM|nr:ADOP family duplicated permease [Oleiagrimonas soli]KGI77104.1 permease [Oleiagrimonas soli]MBB6185359.1 putative permease [Oleiagrimonas soli]
MGIVLNEILRSWRASLRRPGFLLLATAVLALGIGATASVFMLIDQVLLKPLPVPQVSRLAVLGPLDGGQVSSISPQQYQHLQSLSGVRSIGLMEGFTPTANIAGGGAPEQVPVTYADRHLLPTLGLHVQLGRNFNAQEDAPHGPKVVILTHGFWLRRYGGDPGVIGRDMQVEGVPHAIIGVLPASFDAVGNDGDIMLPTALRAGSLNDGTNYMAVARLDQGTTVASVAQQVDARLHAMYAQSDNKYWLHAHFGAQDFREAMHADSRPKLILFLCSALFVLLIALVNLTNLMLLRSLSRHHDVAVRSALGAPRLRLVLPALAEGLLIGVGGALLGVLLAASAMAWLQHFIPAAWLSGGRIHLGASVWFLGLALGIVGALLAAGLGLWRSHSGMSSDELREGGRSGIGVRSGRLGRALVVVQMALAMALLSVAGVFLHTLYDAARTPLGYASQGILTVDLAPVKAEYPDAASVASLSRRLVERFRGIPGVDSAVGMTNLPGGTRFDQFNIGALHAPGGEEFNSQYHAVGPGFFRLFGIHLLQGRAFSPSDIRGGEAVAIVNQAMAEKLYGGHALGKTIQQFHGESGWSARIVGVVGNTKQFGPLGSEPTVLYVPLAQVSEDALRVFRSFEPMRFAIRVHGDPNGYREALRQAIAEVAPDQPIAHMRTMSDVVASTLDAVRLNLLLVGVFSALSLLLASAGLYAVMAVAVAAREREFGVRTALGASPSRLIRLVLRGGLLQIAIGLALGVVLALSFTSMLRAVMEQIGRSGLFDPGAMLCVALALSFAGLLACLIPALRAARTLPMTALRGE